VTTSKNRKCGGGNEAGDTTNPAIASPRPCLTLEREAVQMEVQSNEFQQALRKAKENERLAARAKTAKDREYYERMRKKWLGLAEGWRMIDEVAGISVDMR